MRWVASEREMLFEQEESGKQEERKMKKEGGKSERSKENWFLEKKQSWMLLDWKLHSDKETD